MPPPIRPQVTRLPQHLHGWTGAPAKTDPGYAECPHPDFHPVASADPAELRGPGGRKPSMARGAVGIATVYWIFPGTAAIS